MMRKSGCLSFGFLIIWFVSCISSGIAAAAPSAELQAADILEAAGGRLYMSTVDGKVLCLAPNKQTTKK